MDISGLASRASDQALSSVQGQASLAVLKKANSLAGQEVLQLLQALPAPAPVEPGQPGAIVNTYA